MSKKYKLIKEYPDSPKLGVTVSKICDSHEKEYYKLNQRYGWETYSKKSIENNPEFWELVEEKSYEILEYDFTKEPKPCPENKNGCPCGYPIHSVKRLSDGDK